MFYKLVAAAMGVASREDNKHASPSSSTSPKDRRRALTAPPPTAFSTLCSTHARGMGPSAYVTLCGAIM